MVDLVGFRHQQAAGSARPSARTDEVLILHTSGSTGLKKKVPFTLERWVVGMLCVARSRKLEARSAKGAFECLNMLPLFHNAGIFRSLTALLLGGSVLMAGARVYRIAAAVFLGKRVMCLTLPPGRGVQSVQRPHAAC